jgi:hypothetical protein
MEFNDFMRLILTAWPDAVVDENQLGELVILTGHRVNNEGMVVRLEPDESF